MADQILAQMAIAFQPWMIWVCLLGVTLGILWGAMPGLSTTMAMALLIGLSTGMTQHVAIMFMLGAYTGSVFGAAISAVERESTRLNSRLVRISYAAFSLRKKNP